eukprot:TRINITY_DN1364_c3_g1_i1.p1 TRINITY_DN1364_c3_g1~~TRINITY_DN1364_c3_g1_i1.p1  ORF type:complete len:617 (-),score=180.19 TRINITY_DN1364_c3_g1_i1:219-1985(-)
MEIRSAMDACLIHVGSTPTASIPEKVVLNKPAFKIGRLKDQVDILLTSQTKAQVHISRHHATILQDGDSWHIVDNQSANGVFVNDSRVTDHLLVDGDEIVFGVLAKDTEFKYKYVAAKPGAAKSAGLALPLPMHTRQGLALGTWKGPDQMAMTFKRLRDDAILRDAKSTMASGGVNKALEDALQQLEERQKDLELASDLGMMLLNKNQEMNEELQELRPQLEQLQDYEQKYLESASAYKLLDDAHITLVQKCKQAEFARDEYHNDLQRLQSVVDDAAVERKRLQEQLVVANQRGDEFMTECNELRGAVEQYRAHEASVAKREAQWKESKASMDDKLSELQLEIERLQSEAQAKQKQSLTGHSREMDQLRSELAAVMTERDNVTEQLTAVSREANVLRDEKSQHSEMLSQARTTISALNAKIEELQMEAQMAQPGALPLSMENSVQQQQETDQQQQQQQQQQELQQRTLLQQQQLVDAQRSAEQAAAQVVALTKQFEDASAATTAALSQCRALREQLAAVTAQSQSQQSQADDSDTSRLKQQVADLQQQVQSQKATIERLERHATTDLHTPLLKPAAAKEKERGCCCVM